MYANRWLSTRLAPAAIRDALPRRLGRCAGPGGKFGQIAGPISIRRGYNPVTPTVLREGPYRIFFYASDREEPPHVHVRRDDQTAKFWLEPVRCQRSGGMRRSEVRRIERIIQRRQRELMEAWDAYFDR